jgi:hypothetical protein
MTRRQCYAKIATAAAAIAVTPWSALAAYEPNDRRVIYRLTDDGRHSEKVRMHKLVEGDTIYYMDPVTKELSGLLVVYGKPIQVEAPPGYSGGDLMWSVAVRDRAALDAYNAWNKNGNHG